MFVEMQCQLRQTIVSLGVVVALGVGSIHTFGQEQPSPSAVELRDGSTVRGDLQGRVVLASPPPARFLVVVDGADLTAMKAAGIEVKKGAIVTRIGLPQTSAEAVWKMTNEQVLSTGLPVAERKQPAEVAFNLRLEAVLSGKVDGQGVGSIAVPGGFVYFFREVNGAVPNNMLVLGELQVGRAGAVTIVPALRVRGTGGLRTLPVASLSSTDQKK